MAIDTHITSQAGAEQVYEAELEPGHVTSFSRLSATIIGSATDVGVIVVDRALRTVLLEGEIFEQIGMSPQAAVGRPLAEAMTARSAELLLPQWRAALDGAQRSLDYRSDDAHRDYSVSFGPLDDGRGSTVAAVAVIRDLTDTVVPLPGLESAVALRDSEERLRVAQRVARIGNWEHRLDEDTFILSDNLPELLDLPEDEAAGISLEAMMERVHPEDQRRVNAHIASRVARGEPVDIEFRILHRDGSVREIHSRGSSPSPTGDLVVRRGIIQDITERKVAERALHRAQELFREGFDKAQVGMGVIDVARRAFTDVNSALGKITGYDVDEMKADGFLLRISGDEHAADDDAVFDGLASDKSKFDSRQVPVRHRDGSVRWVSRNLSPIRDAEGRVTAVFLQMADITDQRNREEALETEVEELAWISQIRDALDDDRFVLFAQPIVHLATGEVVQHELLIRMLDEDGGLVPPGAFLPIAEKYGQICDIDRWVVARGAEIAAAGVPVAINLSGASIGHPSLLGAIETALVGSGADANSLVFEITETALMGNLDRGELFARQLMAMGCRFSLDDFGTGFGSFIYLKRLPAHFLKIDMEFVTGLVQSERDQHVVRAIVSLAEGFGQQTIAEGVEDEATLQLLVELGVSHAQGYHVGRPAPVADRLLRAPAGTEVQ